MEKQQRLIDADALMKNIGKIPQLRGITYGRMKRAVEETPSIDAETVRHGHVVWKNRFMGGFVPDVTITDKSGEKHTGTLDTTHYEPVPYCSECGKELGVSSLAYCPNCGAKMDGGAEEK